MFEKFLIFIFMYLTLYEIKRKLKGTGYKVKSFEYEILDKE